MFVGEIDDDQLEAHYHQADVFVLPSYHEGYGMVLSEAIARGLPIICSDAGAMPQTVPEGAGILVPPGNVSLLSNALLTFMSNQSAAPTTAESCGASKATLAQLATSW